MSLAFAKLSFSKEGSTVNRKKFWADYNLVQSWLERQGIPNSDFLLLKIIALVLQGQTQPEMILETAVSSPHIIDVLQPKSHCANMYAIPDNIRKLLGFWMHSLPRNNGFIGEIYEKISVGRKSRGIYYTPQAVIDFIIGKTLSAFDLAENPFIKVLDPACGCGYFLLSAYDYLFEKYCKINVELTERYPEGDWSEAGIQRHILTHNLWGADIDPQAADITRLSLCLKAAVPVAAGSFNIITYDTLKKPEEGSEASRFWAQRYQCVIGNPPYLSFGLRGAGKLENHYKEYLRKNYSVSEYKLSYYALFIERGIELLTERGRLGFILPDSFLHGRYYSKIRRFIMDTTVIKSITLLSVPVFKKAATGYSVICVLSRESQETQRKNHIMEVYRPSSLANLPPAIPVCRYEQNYFNTLPYQRFRLFFNSATKELVEYMDRSGGALHRYATGHSGIRAVSRQEDIVALASGGKTWQRGLISGSQIVRYGLRYQGHWLNIDPALLYKGGWRSELVEQRKLLLRQTGDGIIACIDEQHYYHLNNIHSFVLKDDKVSLDYLLLLLNSRLMAFYYHVTTLEHGRSLAQTDIETLELLPIVINEQIDMQAFGLVKTMNHLVSRRLQGDLLAERQIHALDDYFNQLVYRIYRLTDSQIRVIEQYETAPPSQRSLNLD
jgi:hypothetical protein